MSLNNLRPPRGARRDRKRVGRGPGSGHGKTASRGSKGAKSRSGFRFKRGFEGGQMPLHRRVPKRGFHNPFRVEYAVVNLDTLAEVFDAGSSVTPELLRERGLVRVANAPVKVLGRGDISKQLTVHAHKFSGSAAQKIAAAGGAAELIETARDKETRLKAEAQQKRYDAARAQADAARAESLKAAEAKREADRAQAAEGSKAQSPKGSKAEGQDASRAKEAKADKPKREKSEKPQKKAKPEGEAQ
jgi:large subunit ribosomal protein L15